MKIQYRDIRPTGKMIHSGKDSRKLLNPLHILILCTTDANLLVKGAYTFGHDDEAI
jgi:hypothetical protein